MATFRLLNEFGVSSVVLALENASKCVCHCQYCFAELNKKVQWAGKARRDEDPGSFERAVERAFGPEHDPTDFRQWSLRNRMPVGWANTVEPFQDLPQAEAILRICDKQGIPLFLQTKGHNFEAIWPTLRSVADNAVLFASFPTDDDRALKRFEPGTPRAAARAAMIERAADAGFAVTLALAPYHEDWCADPAAFIRRAASWGVRRVFVDRLHLNERQVGASTDPVTVRLATGEVGAKYLDHAQAIHEAADACGLGLLANCGLFRRMGLLSTEPCLTPRGSFRRAGSGHWPYFDGHFLQELDWQALTDDAPDAGPVVVEWGAALAAMEADAGPGHDQPLSWRGMSELMAVRRLAPAWREALGERRPGAAAPARDYYRALWNSPSTKQFGWRHPSLRVALRPDGTPWLDPEGNIVGVFDAGDEGPGWKRTFASLDDLARLTWDQEPVPDDDED